MSDEGSRRNGGKATAGKGRLMEPVIDSWWSAPRTWHDVVRCVLGLHRPASDFSTDIGRIQRCTCGAFGPRPWFYMSRSEAREKWRTQKRREEWFPC